MNTNQESASGQSIDCHPKGNNMRFSKLTRLLRTWNIHVSVAFYRDVFTHLIPERAKLILSGPTEFSAVFIIINAELGMFQR